ncbi:MAG: hypothetical protein DRP01_04655 [Archaeoglobales archaeon]|nr:MAG: hypothetical protein DRP01_04655 [Archaeoglobales archaeon]
MEELMPLIVSILLNILLLILTILFKKNNTVLYNKLDELQRLIKDFLEAYEDKVITPEEAQRLIEDVRRLVEDP